jgi:hypothetical protein
MTKIFIPFEKIWENSEKLHEGDGSPTTAILDELSMKINLYKMIDSKTDVPDDERQKVKSRTMGEILLTLTHLSLKDNINVYEALSIASQYRNAENLSKIPPDLKLPGVQ